MKVLAVLLLAVFTAGCNASFLDTSRPQSKLDVLRNIFWMSVDHAGQTVQEIGRKFEETEIGRELRDRVDEAVQWHVKNALDQIPNETKDMILNVAIWYATFCSDLERSVKETLEPVVDNWVWPIAQQVGHKLTEESEPVVDWLGQTLEPVTQYFQEHINTITSLYQSQLRQLPSEQ